MADEAKGEALSNEQALKIIEESGILNPNMKLKDLLSVAKQVSAGGSAASPQAAQVVDWFIHGHFCLYYEQ